MVFLTVFSIRIDFDRQLTTKRLFLLSVPKSRVRGQDDIEAVLLRCILERVGDGAILRAISAVIVSALQLINTFRRYALRHATPFRDGVFHHGQPVGHGDRHLLVGQIQRALHLNVQSKLLGEIHRELAAVSQGLIGRTFRPDLRCFNFHGSVIQGLDGKGLQYRQEHLDLFRVHLRLLLRLQALVGPLGGKEFFIKLYSSRLIQRFWVYLFQPGQRIVDLLLHRAHGADEGAHGIFLGIAAGRVMGRMMGTKIVPGWIRRLFYLLRLFFF